MKTKIFIFSSLLGLCGAVVAHASDCVGDGCDIEPVVFEQVTVDTNTDIAAPVLVPEHNIKVLTVKPVMPDNRMELFGGDYAGHDSVKTVDSQNGVPIWDDSINSYRYKDFSDWFLEPAPEFFVQESVIDTDPMSIFQQNMIDAASTRARVEELLAPRKPSNSLWFDNATPSDTTVVISDTFDFNVTHIDNSCPFETDTECQIWRKKPIVRETVSPRSPKLRDAHIDAFIDAASCDTHITANADVAKPLLARYKLLMQSAQACCTDGMAYELRQAGASDDLIYKFLVDDANFYGFGARCLMTTDYDLDTKYPNTATAVVVADVRNGCLCRGRQWFEAMLAPFQQVYNIMPEFQDMLFNYTYTDGLGREITVSVNNDVQNVLKQLSQCP